MYRPMTEELEQRDCPSVTPAQITAVTSNQNLTQGQMVAQLQNLGLSTRQVYMAIWEPVSTPDAGNPHPITVTWAPNEPAGTVTTGPTYTAPPGGPWVLNVDANGVSSWQAAPPLPTFTPVSWGSVPAGYIPPAPGQPITPPAGGPWVFSVTGDNVASWTLASDIPQPDFTNYGAAFVLAHKDGQL